MVYRYVVIFTGLICITLPSYAISGIHKYKNAEGGISFQEHPCDADNSEIKLHSSITLLAGSYLSGCTPLYHRFQQQNPTAPVNRSVVIVERKNTI